MNHVLEIRNLKILFPGDSGDIRAVEGIDLTIAPGERVAIVGESGCGKSVTGMSCMKLLRSDAVVAADRFAFTDRSGQVHDLRELSEAQMQQLRAAEMAMIFQDPSTFLNPVMTIGEQLDEVFLYHTIRKPAQAREKSLEMLKAVGVPDPQMRLNQYPHELSGGLKQRVLIAMATALTPGLLIADEPTTALDVTIQAQILDLIRRRCEQERMALLMITHDLGVVREMAQRVYVMYCGKIVEQGTVEEILSHPRHPYTKALIDTIPDMAQRADRFVQIPGNVPHPAQKPQGCYFSNRCAHCTGLCKKQMPPLFHDPTGHRVRCWYTPEELWQKSS